MESDIKKLSEALFPDWSPNKRAGRIFACRCLGHRLRKFGFESHINHLSARELAMQSVFLCSEQAKHVLEEVRQRAEQDGDHELLRIIA